VSLIFPAWLSQVSGAPASRAAEWATAAIHLAIEYGFLEQEGHARELRGWALQKQTHVDEGLAEMLHGAAIVGATGSAFSKPNFLAVLAETQARAGQLENGLTTLAEAFIVLEKTGERWYEAELYRLKGELLLQQERKAMLPEGAL
jgi:predicted ATPase